MNQADVVRRYLHDPRDVDFPDTGFPFITISRQAGTEAHALGRYIIMRLSELQDPDLNTGWDLFDQKLCALIAQNKKLDADYETLVTEKYRTGGIHRMIYELLIGTPQEYRIQKKIEEVVHLLARLGKAVIIGRGGFLVARNMPGAIHIRLIASLETRLKNVREKEHLSEKIALQRIRETDAERSAFLKSQFNFDVRDLSRFDIVWNLDRLRLSEVICSMAELVQQRMRHLRQSGAIRQIEPSPSVLPQKTMTPKEW